MQIDGRFISAPSPEDFLQAYRELGREFNTILVMTLSNYFLPVAEVAQKASLQHGGMAHIAVLDSKQIGPGLGMLAQLGAQAILAGESLQGVEEHIRAAIPHIYMLIHIDPESLSRYPDFSPSQSALRDEELGVFPLLALEDGQLVPYKKVRTRRHLLESFQEFVEEFETPQRITFLRGRNSAIRSRLLREISRERFPQIPFSEMEMPAPLVRLFGLQAAGVTVMEMP